MVHVQWMKFYKNKLNNRKLKKGKVGELTENVIRSWNMYQGTDQLEKFNKKGHMKMITKSNIKKANCMRKEINRTRKGGNNMKELKVLVKRCKFCNKKLHANAVKLFSTDENSLVYYEYEKCDCKEAKMFWWVQTLRQLQKEYLRQKRKKLVHVARQNANLKTLNKIVNL